MFSPLASTTTRATPVGSVEVDRNARSIPRASRSLATAQPRASSPTQPTNRTSAPSSFAAAAWFAPFPPSASANCPSVTVSPGAGRRGPCQTRSTFADPTTTTLPVPLTALGLALPLTALGLVRSRRDGTRDRVGIGENGEVVTPLDRIRCLSIIAHIDHG